MSSNSMYESHFNGWMQFQWLGASTADLLDFKSKITAAGTIWTPDHAACNWPARGALDLPPDGSTVGLYSRGAGRFLSASPANGGDLKADQSAYSATSSDAFVIERAGPRRVRLKTTDGRYVRTTRPSDTLSPGIQIMRFWRDAGADFNVNRFTVSPAGGGYPPRIETGGINFGVTDSRFGFDITGSGGQVVFVDASATLVNPDWTPLATNTLTGFPGYFSDPEGTHHAARFYRLRWPQVSGTLSTDPP